IVQGKGAVYSAGRNCVAVTRPAGLRQKQAIKKEGVLLGHPHISQDQRKFLILILHPPKADSFSLLTFHS
ncbi:MAG: hypothetical protein ACM3N9_02125, partial [Syntrophothermus sp.]